MQRMNRERAQEHRRWIELLEESTPAQWGGMTAAEMLGHLRAVYEASLGEITVPQLVPSIIGKPFGFLAFYVLPRLPRGKKGSTPPIPALCPAVESFEAERAGLLAAMNRFLDRLENDPSECTLHPITGMTTLRTWARVHEVHFAHHFRQFGITSAS
jgi:oxepin-CoA hydrolase/3-oxo-5,6-dehydrosuberyl-CoA semialdehyde dehydrogenase